MNLGGLRPNLGGLSPLSPLAGAATTIVGSFDDDDDELCRRLFICFNSSDRDSIAPLRSWWTWLRKISRRRLWMYSLFYKPKKDEWMQERRTENELNRICLCDDEWPRSIVRDLACSTRERSSPCPRHDRRYSTNRRSFLRVSGGHLRRICRRFEVKDVVDDTLRWSRSLKNDNDNREDGDREERPTGVIGKDKHQLSVLAT